MPENENKTYARFDRTEFPLITVTFTGIPENKDNFQTYLQGLLQNYDRREEFVLIFDASHAATPSPKYQKLQANWMKDHDKLVKTYCRGVGYVVPSPFLRGILKVIFGLQKNPVPFVVFKDLQPAREWAREQL
jgi:hypothetical protein